MKKNEVWDWIAFIAAIVVVGLIFLLGFYFPIMSNSELQAVAPMHPVLIILLGIVIGWILNAVLIEVGHLIGAKIGRYNVRSVNIIYCHFQKNENGKISFGFKKYDGLFGETKIVPKDIKKSSPKAYSYFPLLFLLIEVCALVPLIVMGMLPQNALTGWVWWRGLAIIILAIAAGIYLYDYFPAAIGSKNDGYLLTILTNQTNKEAYNQMLLGQDILAKGGQAPELPVYDKVTNFTSQVNDITYYARLAKKDYAGALDIVEKTIACKDTVNENIYLTAVTNKISLLIFMGKLDEAKEYYVLTPVDVKKYIAQMRSIVALRGYVLINGLIDNNETETKAALDKADALLKKTDKDQRGIEEDLVREALRIVIKAQPTWDFSAYDAGEETPAETKVEEKTEEKPEVKEEPKDDKKAE